MCFTDQDCMMTTSLFLYIPVLGMLPQPHYFKVAMVVGIFSEPSVPGCDGNPLHKLNHGGVPVSFTSSPGIGGNTLVL